MLYALYIGVRALCKTYSARALDTSARSLYIQRRARTLSLYTYIASALYIGARALSPHPSTQPLTDSQTHANTQFAHTHTHTHTHTHKMNGVDRAGGGGVQQKRR